MCYWGWDGRGRRGKLHNVQSTKSKLQLNIPTQSILSSPDSLPCQAVWLAMQTLAQTLVGHAVNHVTWCVIFWRTPTSGVFNRVAWLMVPGCIVWVGGLFLKRAPLEISIQTCRWCAATLFLTLHTLWEVLKIFSCDFLLGDTLTLYAFLTTSKLTSQLQE